MHAVKCCEPTAGFNRQKASPLYLLTSANSVAKEARKGGSTSAPNRECIFLPVNSGTLWAYRISEPAKINTTK